MVGEEAGVVGVDRSITRKLLGQTVRESRKVIMIRTMMIRISCQ